MMLRLENGAKNPQHVAEGGCGGFEDAAGQSLPYFSCNCGSTASTNACSLLPAAWAVAPRAQPCLFCPGWELGGNTLRFSLGNRRGRLGGARMVAPAGAKAAFPPVGSRG